MLENEKGKWEVVDGNLTLIEESDWYKEELHKIRSESILRELQSLDAEVPRLLEDLIKHIEYKVHESKQAIISRKEQLRSMLKNL